MQKMIIKHTKQTQQAMTSKIMFVPRGTFFSF